jgi:hypothetical protein
MSRPNKKTKAAPKGNRRNAAPFCSESPTIIPLFPPYVIGETLGEDGRPTGTGYTLCSWDHSTRELQTFPEAVPGKSKLYRPWYRPRKTTWYGKTKAEAFQKFESSAEVKRWRTFWKGDVAEFIDARLADLSEVADPFEDPRHNGRITKWIDAVQKAMAAGDIVAIAKYAFVLGQQVARWHADSFHASESVAVSNTRAACAGKRHTGNLSDADLTRRFNEEKQRRYNGRPLSDSLVCDNLKAEMGISARQIRRRVTDLGLIKKRCDIAKQ